MTDEPIPMQRRQLLLLSHRIPYPPNKGDKVRSFHWLKHLSQRFDVHLGAFVDDPNDWKYQSVFQDYCASWKLLPIHPYRARIRSALSLLSTKPLTLSYFHSREMQGWVQQTLASFNIDAAFIYSSPMAQYVMREGGAPQVPVVVDLVDVDSAKWSEYARGAGPGIATIYRREAKHLLRYERAIAEAARISLFVSNQEADLFRSLVPGSRASITSVPNGVDTAYFDPDADLRNPYVDVSPPVVFTGAMDYRPNIDAVSWFAKSVMPLVHAHRPDLRFYIVGSSPSPDVRRLASPSVVVTGTVDDIRPYMRFAGVCVAPMRIARGVQNKVLEGMAMGRPVVVSQPALDGLNLEPGKEVLLADSAASFAEAVVNALTGQGATVACAARQAVLRRYSWQSSFDSLDEVLTTALGPLVVRGAPQKPATKEFA